MSEPVIRVENLSKKYVINHQAEGGYSSLRDTITEGARSLGRLLTQRKKNDRPTREEFWALKDVSFEVKKGDRLGIIGRNGAGKSTLLKILSRITEPTTGEISIHGTVTSLLEVGTGFHPELTGRENIYLNGAILGMSKVEIKKRFDEIVAFSEIEKFLDTPVKRYSSGMYVRLAFAVAAHLESEILIVDEVLAVGDLEFQRKCLGKIQTLSKAQDRTILFVSHNIDAIQKLCSHCIFLKGGKIKIFDETRKVLSDYISDFTFRALPNQWIDISGIKRSGSMEAYFSAIRYSSLNKSVDFQPYADGPLECLLEVFSNCQRTVNSLAITIYEKAGFKLLNTDILALKRIITLQEGRTTIKFTIHALHLKPGTYTLGLWLAKSIGSTVEYEIYDFSECVFEFDIISWEKEHINYDGVITVEFDVSEINLGRDS